MKRLSLLFLALIVASQCGSIVCAQNLTVETLKFGNGGNSDFAWAYTAPTSKRTFVLSVQDTNRHVPSALGDGPTVVRVFNTAGKNPSDPVFSIKFSGSFLFANGGFMVRALESFQDGSLYVFGLASEVISKKVRETLKIWRDGIELSSMPWEKLAAALQLRNSVLDVQIYSLDSRSRIAVVAPGLDRVTQVAVLEIPSLKDVVRFSSLAAWRSETGLVPNTDELFEFDSENGDLKISSLVTGEQIALAKIERPLRTLLKVETFQRDGKVTHVGLFQGVISHEKAARALIDLSTGKELWRAEFPPEAVVIDFFPNDGDPIQIFQPNPTSPPILVYADEITRPGETAIVRFDLVKRKELSRVALPTRLVGRENLAYRVAHLSVNPFGLFVHAWNSSTRAVFEVTHAPSLIDEAIGAPGVEAFFKESVGIWSSRNGMIGDSNTYWNILVSDLSPKLDRSPMPTQTVSCRRASDSSVGWKILDAVREDPTQRLVLAQIQMTGGKQEQYPACDHFVLKTVKAIK